MVPLKYAADLITDRTDGAPEGERYVGLEHIEGGFGRFLPVTEGMQTSAESTVNRFKIGDVLFGKLRPYLAKAAVADTNGNCSSEILVYRPRSILPEYLKHTLLLEGFIQEVTASTYGSKMPRADAAFIGRIPIPVPPGDEQVAIASYLDAETKRIDGLIEEKTNLLAQVKTLSIASIDDAIEGRTQIVGSTPVSDWQSARLRFKAKVNPRPSKDLDENQVVSFLAMEAIGEDGSLQLDETRKVCDVSQGYTYFEEGDVTIAKITPCFENRKGAVMAGLIDGAGFGTTELIVLRPEEDVDAKFLYYVTQSSRFRLMGEASMTGSGGQKRVSDLYVKNFETRWPPRHTQSLISVYLDVQLSRNSKLIAHVEAELALLKELRSSTIADAVLGRIDVRNMPAN